MASEGKFTPGPWHYHRGEDYLVVQATAADILQITLPDAEDEANARLIAAAPKLYQAAELASDALRIAADLIASQFPQHIAESSCIELARRELDAAISSAGSHGE